MKKIILAIIILCVLAIVGFSSVAMAKGPDSNPVQFLTEFLKNITNTTQMESISGNITESSDSLVLDYPEVRHISLTLYAHNCFQGHFISRVNVVDKSVEWYHVGSDSQVHIYEVDTNHLVIHFRSAPVPGDHYGTLYYNITTTYPAKASQ